MKNKAWMLLTAIICGMSSFAVANECETCNQSQEITTQEKKESTEVATADAPTSPEAPSTEPVKAAE